MATVLMAVAFFAHTFLPKREYDITAIKEEIIGIRAEINKSSDSILALAQGFSNRAISEIDFRAGEKQYSAEISNLTHRLKEKEIHFNGLDSYYKDRYFGFPSRRLLFYNAGLGAILCILSFGLIYLGLSLQDDHKKKAISTLGLMSGIIGSYFFVWILYDRQDLQYGHYVAIMVIMATCAALFGYYLSKITYNSRAKLKRIISTMGDFILLKIPKRYIKEVDRLEYMKDTKSTLEEGIGR